MNTTKTKLAIMFGGKSAEHSISLRSAKNVILSVDQDKYELSFIGITPTGDWWLLDPKSVLSEIKDQGTLTIEPHSKQELALALNGEKGFYLPQTRASHPVDVVFPVLHGPFGEDGSVQGLMQLVEIPFVGPSLLGSAVGMDKDVMKRLLRDAGLPIGRYICLHAEEADTPVGPIAAELGFPCYVKPANLGSSVGISKARNEEELTKAIRIAFQFDRKIVIEENIDGREIECALLGNFHAEASVPGEVIAYHDFYSFDSKYIDDQGSTTQIPADIPPEKQEEIRAVAIQTFRTLECEGLSRVDIFLKKDGNLFVNEINTIPGFTSISMYPMLWKQSGIDYGVLIDRLIQLAFDRFEQQKALKVSM